MGCGGDIIVSIGNDIEGGILYGEGGM